MDIFDPAFGVVPPNQARRVRQQRLAPTREVLAARRALTEGLTVLRESLNETLSTALRGEGGTVRTQTGPRLAGRRGPVGTTVATG